MGRPFSTHEEEEEFIQGFCGRARRKETTRKTDFGGRIAIKWFLEAYYGVVWAGLFWVRIGTICGFS
jgi:hypothetical protein